jgi:hypothetical protein
VVLFSHYENYLVYVTFGLLIISGTISIYFIYVLSSCML